MAEPNRAIQSPTSDSDHWAGPEARLWELWRLGLRPDVRFFLRETGELTPSQLAAVLRIDQRERWWLGQRARAMAYLNDHPALEAEPEAAIELIYGEFLLREELGESPSLDEYLLDYPRYAARLRSQVELHRALAGGTAARKESTFRPVYTYSQSTQNAARWPELTNFVILEELGRGGMGVVYRARQRRPARTVALKMLLAGACASPELLDRLRNEAEAVARMQHPHVVQIFEVTEHDGLTCLVLEYVAGGTLAQKIGGTPQPVNEGARLIETLARTMHQAHAQGIIHRDLKPANVLLSADGTPKITDFGLAKLSEGGLSLTATGETLGTPSYIAPEQIDARSSVGPQADVYALGAILYELLTGRPPFRGESTQETIRQVIFDEPIPPSRLRPQLSRDLETICLKCLEKEPRRRYHSAEVLAGELRRFLDGKPIQARPVGPAGRLWRWGRRDPKTAGLTAAVVALLAAGFVGAGIAAIQFQRSFYRERQLLQNERRARDLAEDQSRLAMDAIRTYHTGVSQDALLRQPELKELRKSLLLGAHDFYLRLKENLEGRRSNDPATRLKLAQACMDLGRLATQIGSMKDARASYEQALALHRGLADEFPENKTHQRDLANNYNALGDLDTKTGRYDDAETALQRALRIQGELVNQLPDEDQYRNDLAGTNSKLGTVYHLIDKLELARSAHSTAMAIRETLVREHPDNETYRNDLALAHHNLGNYELMVEQLDQAESSYRSALALREALARESPDKEVYRSNLCDVQNNLGITLQRAAKYQAAETAHRAALAILEVLVRERPARSDYQYKLSNTHNNLGTLYHLTGRHDRAEASLRLAAEILRSLTRDSPDVPDYALDLGACELNLGRNENDRYQSLAAVDWLDKAILRLDEIYRREPRAGITQDFLFNAYVARAVALCRLGRYAKALDDWDRALVFEPNKKTGRIELERAFTLAHVGRHKEAIAVAESVDTENLGPRAAELTFELARLYSVFSAAERSVAGAAAKDRLDLANKYAARAGGFFQQSYQAGYFANPTHVKDLRAPDPMLDPLRSRPEFQARVHDMVFPVDPFSR
jgi:eukaryotic-like serine/threonine-protein kinase